MSPEISETLQAINNKSAQDSHSAIYLMLAIIITLICLSVWLLCKEAQINHMHLMHELELLRQQLH